MPAVAEKTSDTFTIDDIHRIREQNYYRVKDMTTQEKVEYYNSRGREIQKEIDKIRENRRKRV